MINVQHGDSYIIPSETYDDFTLKELINIPLTIPLPVPNRLGWICPKCGGCNSPDIFSCSVCSKTKYEIENCEFPSFTCFVDKPNDAPFIDHT